MLLSKCFISRIVLKPDWFWFQKNNGKKNRLTSEENGWKSPQNDKKIINTIYIESNFVIIRKIVRKF